MSTPVPWMGRPGSETGKSAQEYKNAWGQLDSINQRLYGSKPMGDNAWQGYYQGGAPSTTPRTGGGLIPPSPDLAPRSAGPMPRAPERPASGGPYSAWRQPAGSSGRQYAGGTPAFDERTGQYGPQQPFNFGNDVVRIPPETQARNQTPNPFGQQYGGTFIPGGGAGNMAYALPEQRPQPFTQNTSFGGQQFGNMGDAFAMRDAFVQSINDARAPFAQQWGSGNLTSPALDFGALMRQAGDMVQGGWANPFTPGQAQPVMPQDQGTPYGQPPSYGRGFSGGGPMNRNWVNPFQAPRSSPRRTSWGKVLSPVTAQQLADSYNPNDSRKRPTFVQ